MGPNLLIAFVFVATDALIWLYIMIYHLDRVPPKGDPWQIRVWSRAVIAGVAGVAGAYALIQVTGNHDLVTTLAGGLIAGRLVGGAIQTMSPQQRAPEAGS